MAMQNKSKNSLHEMSINPKFLLWRLFFHARIVTGERILACYPDRFARVGA